MRIVFFGSSKYVVPVIQMLHNYFDLALVVTTEQGKQEPVLFYCKTNNINYLSVRKSEDLLSSYQINEAMASLGIVADFGLIIPQKTINAFPYGIINIHPSLLPKYRGPTPVQSAILNGDTLTGVTIIKLDKYLDHGPVIAQVEEEIKPEDTADSLYEKLFKKGALLLEKVLPKYETSQVLFVPQNHEHATFTKKLTREDGYIDFKNFSPSRDFFDRMVRAYYPWPGVWTRVDLNFDGQAKIIKFLPNRKIQVEGKKEMDYKDFLNGYPNADKDLIEFIKKNI